MDIKNQNRITKIREMRSLGMSYKAIGEIFGLSGYRISQILNKADKEDCERENFGAWVSQFNNLRIERALYSANVKTPQDIYEIASKHGYIIGIGKTNIDIINSRLDKKIALMKAVKIKLKNQWNEDYYAVVRPLQFKENKLCDWISCDEQSPDFPCLACDKFNQIFIPTGIVGISGTYYDSENFNWNVDEFLRGKKVEQASGDEIYVLPREIIAWQPLPEPYKENEHENKRPE